MGLDEALIQLGILPLALDAAVGPSTPDAWTPLDVGYLERTPWALSEEPTVELLAALLRDPYLGVQAERKRDWNRVLIRVALLANDTDRWLTSRGRPKRLRHLFELLDKGWEHPEGQEVLAASEEDIGTGMQALYALIESPPDPKFEADGKFIGDEEVHEALANYENPLGVRTLMYKYQLRSVARMLQMETQPGTMVDPSYSAFSEAGTGRTYYVDLKKMDIRLQPVRYPLTCGGILCEAMGTGKTLMSLALIIASRHQLTLPPPASGDISAVVTDVEMREYPLASPEALRMAIEERGEEFPVEFKGTPSLAAMCADIVAKEYPHARSSMDFALSPTVERLLDERCCVYYRFPPPARLPRRSKRVPFVPAERYILAPTTLVVVPQILVPQWVAEAETHLDEGALRMLVIKEGKETLPPVEQLVHYDMVLMSIDRFRREGQRDELGSLETELVSARWKRIILDEGNIANNMKSDAMMLAEALSIERRWIVSGTPTTRLKQGTESAVKSFLQSEGMQRVDSGRSRASTPKEAPPRSNRWTKADHDDVGRLGNMLRGFLAAEVFKTEPFPRMVAQPLRKANGPAYGAVDRIRRIMSATMVKHRPGVIDEEVSLPPSTLSAEMVHFTDWQRLTYNALTALVASNVYTSNFEDADYFLHPRNAEAFNQVVSNLHLACLWFSSPEMDIEGAIARTKTHLEKDEQREESKKKLNDKTRAGLEEAVMHMRRAIDTPGWSEWMRNSVASMPYEAGMLPAEILDAWSDSPDELPSLIDAHSLGLLRGLNKRGADVGDIARAGWDERAKRPHTEAFLKMMERAEKIWRAEGKDDRAVTGGTVPKHRNDTKAAAEKPKAPKVMRKVVKAKVIDGVEQRLDEAAKNAARTAELTSTTPRPLPSVIRTRCGSAKVNYVIRSVLSAPLHDKFVIFGTFEEIAHLTEAFELAGISSVYAGAHVKGDKRKSALKDFIAPTMRVCLLELKFAARGLTLTLANRMIFLSPVWSLDVQAQAIKRIHRIGQTRPTHIDILVTEGTFEEDIVRREAATRSNDEEKMYSRALIESPRFVAPASGVEKLDDAYPLRFVPLGTESVADEAAYLRAAGVVTPPTRSDVSTPTPIVTPATPAIVAGATTMIDVAVETEKPKRGIRFAASPPLKRSRFEADPVETEDEDSLPPATLPPPKTAHFDQDNTPSTKRARFEVDSDETEDEADLPAAATKRARFAD